jgi:GxxExxY protein
MSTVFHGLASDCTGQIIDSAIKVHTALGPGLLESAYEACLSRELRSRGLEVCGQVPVPIHYLGQRIDIGYRIDLLVNDAVIVELKTVTRLRAIHEAQLLSYLRLSGMRVGLLLNFHVLRMRDGIRRMVN